jgi:hypothetical protein
MGRELLASAFCGAEAGAARWLLPCGPAHQCFLFFSFLFVLNLNIFQNLTLLNENIFKEYVLKSVFTEQNLKSKREFNGNF